MSRPADQRAAPDQLLSAAEKRLLVWIARRLPAWVTSDQLSALALLAMAGAGASYWLASSHSVGLVLVVCCLAINWFGDSLDGTLARVRAPSARASATTWTT